MIFTHSHLLHNFRNFRRNWNAEISNIFRCSLKRLLKSRNVGISLAHKQQLTSHYCSVSWATQTSATITWHWRLLLVLKVFSQRAISTWAIQVQYKILTKTLNVIPVYLRNAWLRFVPCTCNRMTGVLSWQSPSRIHQLPRQCMRKRRADFRFFSCWRLQSLPTAFPKLNK